MKIHLFLACFLIAQNLAERDEDKLIRGFTPILTNKMSYQKKILELLENKDYSKFTHPVDLAGVTKIINKDETSKIKDYCNSTIEFSKKALTESSENAVKFGIKNSFVDEDFRRAFFMVIYVCKP